MTYRRPNNLIELVAGTGTALVQAAAALVIAGFLVGAVVLVLMR
jgi:hypothetical protein